MKPGVIIVSNRLPVSVKKVGGKLEFSPSAGGLATGLSSYAKKRKNKWIGWPGIANDDLSESDKQEIQRELKKHNCYPVFLSQAQVDDYYNGFANEVLWPAFHELSVNYQPPENYWRAYHKVNKLFAQTALELSQRGSTIWVHDYQLMLVPAMLRRSRPKDKIGFFLHIPFPPNQNFAPLPHANQLLTGLLGSDLLGFHTPSYVQNFLDCCAEAGIGLVGPRKLILPNRVVRVTDFPMGIDYTKFSRAAKLTAVKAEALRLRAKYGRKKIILTVDRLDPSKGLIERLKAYRQFLEQNPDRRGKVVMVMLVVPSRTDIPRYQRLKVELEKLVKQTNQKYGTLRWQPVDYMFKSVAFKQLAALYQSADVAFIAPTKDGMNLVAKEYLASQPTDKGVLVLSQTAGAAGELKDAIIVDPSQTKSLVTGLSHALAKKPKQLSSRVRQMRRHVAKKNVHNWASDFMNTLQQDRPRGRKNSTRQLSGDSETTLLDAYTSSQSRLILMDYDGVLAPLVNNPDDAKPGPEIKKLLTKLATQDANRIFIISGRTKKDLSDWLGKINGLGLIAEHGGFIRPADAKNWQSKLPKEPKWQEEIIKIMERYTAKTPGSHIEIKSNSVVWHYRQASAYTAQKSLVALKRLVAPLAKTYQLKVESGHKVLEVRLQGINKGSAALEQVVEQTDFILAIGDDVTDEDMFKRLPPTAFTVKVGRGRTAAHYRLNNQKLVIRLLQKLTNQ